MEIGILLMAFVAVLAMVLDTICWLSGKDPASPAISDYDSRRCPTCGCYRLQRLSTGLLHCLVCGYDHTDQVVNSGDRSGGVRS